MSVGRHLDVGLETHTTPVPTPSALRKIPHGPTPEVKVLEGRDVAKDGAEGGHPPVPEIVVCEGQVLQEEGRRACRTEYFGRVPDFGNNYRNVITM